MAHHRRMSGQGQAGALAIAADHQPGRLTAERPAALADKECIRPELHLRPFRQPCLAYLEFVTPERVRRGQSGLEPFAQFIAVCSSLILAEILGYAGSFSSPWRGKQRVFERCKLPLMDQPQPSTNADKLSEPGKMAPIILMSGGVAMIPHHIYYQLVVVGLLWLCVMLHCIWAS